MHISFLSLRMTFTSTKYLEKGFQRDAYLFEAKNDVHINKILRE